MYAHGRSQHLAATASGAGRGGDFRLCRRRSFDWKFFGELFEPAGHWQYDGEGRRPVCCVLLGWRDDRPFLRRRNHAKIAAGPVLGVAAIVAFCLVITSMMTFGHVAMWSIILVGLFNSIMWPNIFALGLAELGRLTNLGSSLLVKAVIGAALIPLLQGFVADQIGIHHAFFLPALCYVYICYYGFRGSKVRHAEATA